MENIFVDLESIFNSDARQETERMIKEANYVASSEYLDKTNTLYYDGDISEDDYRNLSRMHYNAKDLLLENLDPHHPNAIDYEKVYNISNIDINFASSIKTFVKVAHVYIIFYYNTKEEYDVKRNFCEKYFGSDIQIIGIKYYSRDYNPNIIRQRTNKALYIRNLLAKENLNGCYLFDKSITACREWQEQLGVAMEIHSFEDKNQELKKSK